MKLLFRKKQKEKLHFLKAPLIEKSGLLVNPARGLFHIYNFALKENGMLNPFIDEVSEKLYVNETLAFIFIDIGAYKYKDLDEFALENIKKTLLFFKAHGKDIILRIAYDHDGKGFEKEPLSFERVLKHLEEIGPLLTTDNGVFVYQGMLVGSWGEMHSSRFAKSEHLTQMSRTLKSSCKDGTWFAVRKPVQWRTICKNWTDYRKAPQINLGLFDDAMFASVTDLGTFGIDDCEDSLKPWSTKNEREFEEALCRYVPNGGEAVFTKGYTDLLSKEEMLSFLSQCHITYLNRGYDENVFKLWKEYGILEKIEESLGYRFAVRDVYFKSAEGFQITIENIGFANLYQEAELFLINGDKVIPLDEDMRTWNSGCIKQIYCDKPMNEGKVFLGAKRKFDGRIIYFANEADSAGRVLLGELSSLEGKH